MQRKGVTAVVSLTAVLLVVAVGQDGATSATKEPLVGDRQPRLAIVSAFAPELEKLVAEARITRTRVINGRTFHIGELRGNNVVMFLTGISMVNASMMTQTALDHFNISGIIVSGIAGGVNPDLSIGDVSVPARWAQYQDQVFARETEAGYQLPLPFHTDQFGHYGMMFPQFVSVTSEATEPDVDEYKFWFDVDPTMLAVAESIADDVQLESCASSEMCLDEEPGVVVGGRGVSGPTFVDNAAYREWVWGNFQANALDMETAAVAHVAYSNAVPMIAFRSLSDLAGGGPGQNELFAFFQLAADNSARVVTSFLEAWRARSEGRGGARLVRAG